MQGNSRNVDTWWWDSTISAKRSLMHSIELSQGNTGRCMVVVGPMQATMRGNAGNAVTWW